MPSLLTTIVSSKENFALLFGYQATSTTTQCKFKDCIKTYQIFTEEFLSYFDVAPNKVIECMLCINMQCVSFKCIIFL